MGELRPMFSIVMPAYNAAATIGETIDSVLGQDFPDWELIITDDGSTDDTRVICDRYAGSDGRISCNSQANAGAGAAVNAAMEQASGRFIVRLDADDLLLPEFCSNMIALISANPEYDIFGSNVYRLMPDGTRRPYFESPRFQHEVSLEVDDLIEACEVNGNAVFRREVFDKVGGYRSGIYNEDYDFWLRAMIAGAKHVYTPQFLALYRASEGQKTEDAVRVRRSDIRILRDAVSSGELTRAQVERAEEVISLLQKNVAFRERVSSLVGPDLARLIFAAAHRLAWLVRPHRRRR